MISTQQLFLPLEEFAQLNNDIQNECKIEEQHAKIIKFSQLQCQISEKRHFEQVKEYLDCFKVFS